MFVASFSSELRLDRAPPLAGTFSICYYKIIDFQAGLALRGVETLPSQFLWQYLLACIFIMLSTIFENEVYLGFLGEEKLEKKTYEQSFLGGRPIFLRKPSPEQLECTVCHKEKLTFICQIFCPLESPLSYNRVLYVFYCERCERVFRCLKQQTAKGEAIEEAEIAVRVISEDSFEVESSGFEVKELQKIIKRAKVEVQDEVIEEKEEEEFEDEEGEVDMKEVNAQTIEKMGFAKYSQEDKELSKEELESLKHAAEIQGEKEEKDLVFEEYKKVMKELEGPVLMYTNIPIPYNNQVINPKHFCKGCNSKLSLELQLTEKLLLLNQKLLRLDWGSLMVFTCSNSCKESEEECVVVQYEIDAIKDSEVSALRKRQKNKKRKEQKERSKDKRSKEEEGSKGKAKQESKPQSKEEQNDDWD